MAAITACVFASVFLYCSHIARDPFVGRSVMETDTSRATLPPRFRMHETLLLRDRRSVPDIGSLPNVARRYSTRGLTNGRDCFEPDPHLRESFQRGRRTMPRGRRLEQKASAGAPAETERARVQGLATL